MIQKQNFRVRFFIHCLVVFLTGIFIPPLWCGDNAASFLEIGVGARALAMGGAFCSLADDGTAFYWNPAGLAFMTKPQLSGMYGPQFGTIENPLGNYHYLGYSQVLPGKAILSVNWIRLTVDDIPLYSDLEGASYWDRLHNLDLRPSGDSEGYIQDVEDAVFFSFAKMNSWQLDLGWDYHKVRIQIPFGVNLKWFRQRLGDHEASGLGLDVGTMIRIQLGDFFETEWLGLFTVGLHVQDVTGSKLSWDTRHQDAIPHNIKWGVSYYHPFGTGKSSISIGYDRDSRWGSRNRWGVEYRGFDVIALRAGLDDGNFTGGVGIRLWFLQVDYAFLSHEFSSLHRLSCSITL
jgi:hypothetical protein